MASKVAASAMASKTASTISEASEKASKMASGALTSASTMASNVASGIRGKTDDTKPGAKSDDKSDSTLSDPLIPGDDAQAIVTAGDDATANSARQASVYTARSAEGILPKNMSQSDMIKTAGVGALAVAGLVASFAAMAAAPGFAVVFMGIITIVNSPVTAKQQVDIAKSVGIRDSINLVREECEFLKTEVDFIQQSVNDLQAQSGRLTDAEDNLSKIATEQGTTTTSLIRLVNENQDILNQMRVNIKSNFVTSVTSIVIGCDLDGDMKINLAELSLLSYRLKSHLETLGVVLDTEKFEAMVREDNDISAVLKFCGKLMYDDEDVDDDASVDSEVTFDFETFVETLDEDKGTKRMTFHDKESMFEISYRYSQGSVEVARGGKMGARQVKSKMKMKKKSVMKQVAKRQSVIAAHKAQSSQSNRLRETRITLGGLVTIRGTSAEV